MMSVKKIEVKLGQHRLVVVANEHEGDYPSLDIYIKRNGELDLIASVEDSLGQLRLLSYHDLTEDDYTESFEINYNDNYYNSRYKELTNRYTVIVSNKNNSEPLSPDDTYSNIIVLKQITTHPLFDEYEIIKNKPKLSNEDIAILCSNGHLPFGYTSNRDKIFIKKADYNNSTYGS